MAVPPGSHGQFDYSEYRSRQQQRAATTDGASDVRATPRPSDPVGADRPEPRSRRRQKDTKASFEQAVSHTSGRPPVLWLVLAASAVAAGIVLALVVGRSPFAVAAWALAGPLAISVLAIFTRIDIEQRARAVYDSWPYATVVYWLVLGAAACGVLLSGWLFANWWARL
ncbi:hypothetical protein [Nocardia sp. NPDC050175]|uniref:hypothetical protein n=1 Tax=Nocardia sp. NPDC050175 TaxID=3364317 RepID=UPI0037B7AAE6